MSIIFQENRKLICATTVTSYFVAAGTAYINIQTDVT